MSDVEIMVILILFPVLSSYSRFVELEKEVTLCLALVVKGVLLGKCTGIISTSYVQDIRGKLCGDRGYIGKAIFEMLFINGIQLVTRVRNNMRNMLMRAEDKILLCKRAVIETVNDELKNIAQIEHSRHRSFNNFIVNILSAIAAYLLFLPQKAIGGRLIYQLRTTGPEIAYFALSEAKKKVAECLKFSDFHYLAS